jgi:hypothetical protein
MALSVAKYQPPIVTESRRRYKALHRLLLPRGLSSDSRLGTA